MDRKLFTEAVLARGIPDEIMAQIDRMEPAADPAIFEKIAESEEAARYAQSFSVPAVTAHSSTSVLLQDIKKKSMLTCDKPKRSSKKGGKSG